MVLLVTLGELVAQPISRVVRIQMQIACGLLHGGPGQRARSQWIFVGRQLDGFENPQFALEFFHGFAYKLAAVILCICIMFLGVKSIIKGSWSYQNWWGGAAYGALWLPHKSAFGVLPILDRIPRSVRRDVK